LAILKASVGVKMELVPLAYPLPYGENLSEVEALHLILAHDLFNELRSLLAIIKNLVILKLKFCLLFDKKNDVIWTKQQKRKTNH